MDEFEKELKQDFLEEATELLEQAEQCFLDLEATCGDPNVLDQIFRFAHNLKGTSRAVGFGDVAEFTHQLEDLILKLKENEVQVNSEVISLLLDCNDHICMMVNELKVNLDASFESTVLLGKITKAINGEFDNSVPAQVESNDNNGMSSNEITPEEVQLLENRSNDQDESGFDETCKSNEYERPQVPKRVSRRRVNEDESIRVNLSKVELLNNYVGELVLLQTVLEQRSYSGIQDELAIKSIRQLSKISKEIQETSMSLRMVPLKSTLQKMIRIVRDTSKVLNKSINLTLSGEDTEIDKTVLDQIVDPLVHIVRNAVDHGIETPQERRDCGKAETGELQIKAYHQGNNLVIEVKDDGKGIDTNIIRQKGIEKKIIREDQNLTESQIIDLLFHPGFSTKEQVSEVSGRGVGMDVVKTNIQQLSGDVEVKTQLGQGSTFYITLPLTLAIIEGMVVDIKGAYFIFPLAQISEFLLPKKEQLHFVKSEGEFLKLRGDVLPLFDLATTLNVHSPNGNQKQEKICVVCDTGNSRFAVKVDDVKNQQQIVVKKIAPDIPNPKGMMGSSILGNGKPTFIIDLFELYKEKLDNKKTEAMTQLSA